MKALPLEVAVGGTTLIASMILRSAVAFVVVVWAMANRYHKTHPLTKTGTKPKNL
jgi:hypothetical protein